MRHARMGSTARQLPRALMGPVRADADPSKVIRDVKASVDDFISRYDARHDRLESALDELAIANAVGRAPGGGRADDPEYTKTFASWFRAGEGEAEIRQANASGIRREIKAALTSGSPADGGYLAPTEWDRKVNKALVTVSPIRSIATVETTTVRAYSTLWQLTGFASGWVGETASRPATTTGTFAELGFAAGEIYANPQITQGLLDDAQFDVEGWMAREVAEEFAKQEGVAFVSGDGTNKPRGILTYVVGGANAGVHPGGNLVVVPSGAAAALPTPDGLVDFVYGLPAPYRINARWVMNSMTAAGIAKMKDGQGNYLWREGLVAGQPATLLGYPVTIDEGMPDVGAGNLAIGFGDFRKGYLVNDRTGIRVIRDPYSNKPFVGFYSTKRVGGGVLDPKAIRLMRIAAS